MSFQVGDIVTPIFGLPPSVYSQKNISCIRGAFYKVVQINPFRLEVYTIPDNAILCGASYTPSYFLDRYIGTIWGGLNANWYTKGNPSKNNLAIFK